MKTGRRRASLFSSFSFAAVDVSSLTFHLSSNRRRRRLAFLAAKQNSARLRFCTVQQWINRKSYRLLLLQQKEAESLPLQVELNHLPTTKSVGGRFFAHLS